ncbi:hypothetical protein PENTCL1PPCAC_5205, partial [Pristionchus entomophagus]
ATFACEFKSVYTINQAWYKLPILGIDFLNSDSVYYNKKKPHRCLYVSANDYSFKGDNKNLVVPEMAKIK